jgi:hypothetical protein
VADPYAGTAVPSFSGCDQTSYSSSGTATFDAASGVYVFCNGLTISSTGNVTLNNGAFVIDRGKLSVSGGAHLTANNATIVFTSSTGANWAYADISGGSAVNVTAPTSGATAGLALFADPRLPTGTAFKLTGGSTQTLTGVVYLPTAAVTYSAGSSSSSGCTKLIVNTINFSGSGGSNLAINCSGYPTKGSIARKAHWRQGRNEPEPHPTPRLKEVR